MLLCGWIVGCLCLAEPPSSGSFADQFTGAAMRLDLFHTGGRGQELFSVDRVRVDGAWAGSRTRLIDPLNRARTSSRWSRARPRSAVLARAGVAVRRVGDHWRGSAAAARVPRVAALPEPKRSVQVNLKKRGADQRLVEVFTTTIDPSDQAIDRSIPGVRGEVIPIAERGPPDRKDDLLILGDGYMQDERDQLVADARRLVGRAVRDPAVRAPRG
ncbi:MAG: peptidase M64 N-terminal domain-containing protein [Planctomycetota bacterium]